MKTAKLISQKHYYNYNTVMGIDSNSRNLAYTVVEKGLPQSWGKIEFSNTNNIIDKMQSMVEPVGHLLDLYNPDCVIIEKSIYVKSMSTVRTMSYFVGGLLMLMAVYDQKCVVEVEPMAWKSFIGYYPINKNMSKSLRSVLGNHRGNKAIEHLRKSQTARVLWHNFPYFSTNDWDIADSCGIALWGWNELVAPVTLEKSKEIILDTDYLNKIGVKWC
jgi:Holliday junction resolvasome RuvABC endonuclease subunit